MFVVSQIDRHGPGIQLRAGRVVEVAEPMGRRLIESGLAVEATAEQFIRQSFIGISGPTETRVVSATETRESRTARRKKHDRSS